MVKEITRVRPAPKGHWVGDGFPVRSMFSMEDELSPFLLLDYAGPAQFPPTGRPRGVGTHPHKGFETVTIVYQGELEHRDSTGNQGRIGPGDVQWMTAASGILHEERHSRDFSQQGGTLEMVQLWVNLPARDKAAPAGYQTLTNQDIPTVDLGEGRGRVRVIAGEFRGAKGPARTFTPVNVWDIRLAAGADEAIVLPADHTTLAVVLQGAATINGDRAVDEAQLALFARAGTTVRLQARTETVILMLSGRVIDEPVAAYGPFVMNTHEEIRQAIQDFESGRMGRIA